MIDKITIERIQKLHPKIRAEVQKMYETEIFPILTGGAYCRFTSTLRTFEEQNELYKLGRVKLVDEDGKKIGIVTKAKGGQSLHNYGLAVDIVIMSSRIASWDLSVDFDKDGKKDWMEVVEVFKRNGFQWGGDWKGFRDYPHFQKTFGYTIKQLQEKWKKGDTFIDNGLKYVNL